MCRNINISIGMTLCEYFLCIFILYTLCTCAELRLGKNIPIIHPLYKYLEKYAYLKTIPILIKSYYTSGTYFCQALTNAALLK